jgi:hypothetical protein
LGGPYLESISSSFRLFQSVKSVFWDNRASNGIVTDDNSGLKGLGLGSAETWHFDMGSSDLGHQLMPTDSIIQTLVFCDFLPGYLNASGLLEESPIACDVTYNNSCSCNFTEQTEQSPVNGEVKWGETLAIQVQGLAQKLAGFNTFIVIPVGQQGGPIGDYTRVMEARRQLAEDAPLLSEYHARLADPSTPVTQPKLDPNKDFLEADIDQPSFVRAWVALAVITALSFLLQIGKCSRKTKENINADLDLDRQSEGKNGVGNQKKRNAGLFMSFVLALGFSTGAKADDGCVVDCIDVGTMIPDQTKYQTPLFIPKRIDLRESCDGNLDMYIKKGIQDWGIKGEDGEPLMTSIYGYVLI